MQANHFLFIFIKGKTILFLFIFNNNISFNWFELLNPITKLFICLNLLTKFTDAYGGQIIFL